MGDLAADSAVEGEAGRYRATLSPDWEIWGPQGGYIAAVALRAAGIECGRARPVSITAHFLGVAQFGPVELTVRVNRRTRDATSLLVDVHQGDRTVLTALVWGVDEVEGLVHHTARRLDVAHPESLPTMAERLANAEQTGAPHPFWDNFDLRPVEWIDGWDEREPSEPRMRTWYRFVPTATFADPWVDACRALVVVDVDGWPAAVRAHVGELDWYAPTVDVEARFHEIASDEPWLLGVADAPIARDGLIGATAEVWTPDGRLVASGGSTLLCRPAHRRPDMPA